MFFVSFCVKNRKTGRGFDAAWERRREMKVQDGYETYDEADFLSRVAKRFCPECGEPIISNSCGRPKKFCSDKCRMKWWHAHPMPEHWKAAEKKLCLYCGKEYTAVRQKGRKRKYCSRACANRARTKEWREENECDNGKEDNRGLPHHEHHEHLCT